MADADIGEKVDIPPVAAPMVGSRALREVEVMPIYANEDIDVDYTKMLLKFKERALFVDGVRKEALSRTRAHHWLCRTAKGGVKSFSLMGPGAERIRTVAPIGFINMTREEKSFTKESGQGYTIYFNAEVYLGSPRAGVLPVIGTCSSDDDFFSTEHVELPYNAENPEHRLALESGEGNLRDGDKTIYIRRRIPAADVTRENIEKSALTNLIVNGVTRVLGIRSISADELKEVGIDPEKIGGFEYGSGKAAAGVLSPADDQKRAEIKKWLIEMNGGDEAKALADLKKRTAFNDYKGCDSWERLTVKQIPRHHATVASEYEKFRGDKGPPAEGTQAAPKGGAGTSRATGAKPSPGAEPGPGGQKPLL